MHQKHAHLLCFVLLSALPEQEGAREVYACTSHPVFSPPAIERLSSGVFEEVIVTNTIPIPPVRPVIVYEEMCSICALGIDRQWKCWLPQMSMEYMMHISCAKMNMVPMQLGQQRENVFPELTILSVANLLGETIWRVYNATSVQALRD
eukprot:1157539-Pelagomonas_calceolata.AAC.1